MNRLYWESPHKFLFPRCFSRALQNFESMLSPLKVECLLHIKGLINSKLIITVKKGVKDLLCYKTSNRYMKFISTIIRIIFFQGLIIDKGLHICYHIGHITIFLLVDSRGVGMSSKNWL